VALAEPLLRHPAVRHRRFFPLFLSSDFFLREEEERVGLSVLALALARWGSSSRILVVSESSSSRWAGPTATATRCFFKTTSFIHVDDIIFC
jgi:hypothetical protein